MKRNFTHPLLVWLVAMALLLSACGPGATEAPSAGGETASIRVWTHQNDAFDNGLKSLAEAYMAENPGVTIAFETFDYDTYIQTLQTALPAKTEADILQMFGSWVCSYAEGGNLAEKPARLISIDDEKAKLL